MSIINEVRNNILPKGNDTDSIFEEHGIDLVSDVVNVYNTYPLTGSYGGVEGWKWSKTFPQDLSKINSRIETSINAETSSYEEGSKLENWQGCVLGGIELKGIEKKYESLRSRWSPNYNIGEYSLYHKSKRLYSNYSLCGNLIEEDYDEDAQELIEINEYKGNIKNICIAMYKRDRRFVNFPFYKYEYDPLLTNPNSYNYEFVDGNLSGDDDSPHTVVTVKQLKTHEVGGNYELLDAHPEILSTWEYAGKGYDTRSVIYTEYFPIKADSFKLVEAQISAAGEVQGDIIEWTEVPEFSFEGNNEFILDNSNGTVTINSMLPEISYKIKRIEDLNGNFKKITFYEDILEVKNNRGKIQVNGQQVFVDYKEKFIDGIYLETNEAIVVGDTIFFIQGGANFTNGTNLYMMYEATVRIDYEIAEEEFLYRSDNKINLKPYKTSDSAGLIEINPFEKHVSYVELAATSDEIVMGLESVRLDATVFNTSGARVKEVETFFYCDFGSFNNGNKIYRTQSNQDGESFAYYTWAYNEKDSYEWITGDDVIHGADNTGTVLYFDATGVSINASQVSSVSIFQTLKVDPFYGYGKKFYISSSSINGEDVLLTFDKEIENIEEYIGNQMMYTENITQESEVMCPESTNNHAFGFIKSGGQAIKFIVTGVIDKKTIKTKNGFFEDGFIFDNKLVELYKGNETEYSPTLREERGFSFDRLLYWDDGNNLVPIRPSSIDEPIIDISPKHSISFLNRILPMPDENDPLNIVAGYKVFLDKKAKIYAKVKDPATGREIRSNTITINVTLPAFLKSNDGFKIGNSSEEGSGFGGANFLRLEQTETDSNPVILYNPFKNGINIIIDNIKENL
jgi:hypothetical protein